MKPLKIVLISQNCYPKLGPRSHRTTELAKELARQGHDITVYALLGDYDYSEYSNQTGIKFKSLGKSKFGLYDNIGWYNKKIIYRLVRKLFRNILEFPMLELMWMTENTLKMEEDIDYLITIAHPHPIHWGAAKYIINNHNKINLWVADCGDPFMKDPFNYHPPYFKFFEKRWGKLADFITVPIESAKDAYYQEFRNKIRVIPQGFSFSGIKLATYSPNQITTFAYSGVVYKDKRDPTLFLEYLCGLEDNFKFVIYTDSREFYSPYIKRLGAKLELRNYVPREVLLYELSKMDFLINIKNISGVQQPSKLIDYGMTNRPIIEISSSFYEQDVFEQFLSGNYCNRLENSNIEKYNIKNIAREFVSLYPEQI